MSAAPDLIPSQRAAFDLPRDRVWMNCAQRSLLHRDLRAAAIASLERKAAPWSYPAASFFDEAEETRAAFARLIGARADDVAIIPSCSYGMAVAAQNLPVAAGQRILVVEGQFPSNVHIWRRRAEDACAELVTVPRVQGGPNDGAVTAPLLEAIDGRTAIVACAAVHWSDGTPIDLLAVSERCRAAGAALALDLTQSLGAVPFDLAAVDPDFLVCPSYKWLLGPYSLGCLYASPRRQDGRPLEETWMNRRGAQDFSGLSTADQAYIDGARRYDMGEKANFHLMPMLRAALRLLLDWRPERIAATLAARNARLAEAMAERGFAPPPDALRSPHYFGLRLPPGAPGDLAERLAAEQVHVSVRAGKLRISPHLWIDDEDEARFLAALDRAMGRK